MPKRKREERGIRNAKRIERLGHAKLQMLFQLHLLWRLGELETRKGIADFLVTPPHIQPTWENKQEALIVEMKASAAKRKPNFIGADKTESEEEEEEEEEEEGEGDE